MAFTYDLATNVGKVRLLIADTVEDGAVFEDEELTALLTMEGSVVKSAAARALETLAANKAKLAVRVTRGSVTDDLSQVAKELRESAKQLRAEADSEDDGAILQQAVSPSWERFSHRKNILADRVMEQ